MEITYDLLVEKKACCNALVEFKEHFGAESVDVWALIKRLEERKDFEGYITWLFTELNLTGIAREWHDNGNLFSEHNYKNGKLHGVCRWWHEDGAQKSECSYMGGVLHGTSKRWSHSGRLRGDDIYVNGVNSEEDSERRAHGFLGSENKDLDPGIIKLVNENFWNLLL